MTSSLISPYPDNSRSEWVHEFIEQPTHYADGLCHFSYKVWATAKSRDRGDLPFLLNSHKAMIRETHMRMVQPTPGFYRHISGIDVPFDDMEEFQEKDARAYRWIRRWEDDRQRVLGPFMFNTYGGTPEELDPQWEREIFQVPQAGQVSQLIDRYLAGVEARRLSGDHRGTTLDLQVGASSDDAEERHNGSDVVLTGGTIRIREHSTNPSFVRDGGFRFTNVTVPQGATIDVAFATIINHTIGGVLRCVAALQDIDDGGTFVTTDGDLSDRTQTIAKVTWNADGLGANDVVVSPSLVNTTQTLVNRAAWAASNAIVLLLFPPGLVTEQMYARAYDFVTADAALFHIEYTAGPTGIVPFRRRIEGY